MLRPSHRALTLLAAAAICSAQGAGCQWCEQLKGDGFPAWSESLGAGARGQNTDAKPSGFFTDRRSEQIERNLGGGF